jgi:GTPase
VHTFLDEATIFVKAGDGGNGAMHFHREKYVPLGGPDGGDGGRGGSVVLRAERGLNTLFPFKRQRRFIGEAGQAGGAAKMKGRMGKDLVVDVPVGTVVRDHESGETLGDLARHSQTITLVKGGRGGLGNVHFKTSTNQAPHFAEKGEPGTERWLDLELKVIADVGLVGLPNAGKSTLLSVMSAARPKIAEYPFTTLTPNLGVVDAGDATFVAADIPGLIEGAHEGVGLGHEFLRHIERTSILLHVVDGSADDPIRGFEQVNRELDQYDAGLLLKPQLVVVNKMDQTEARERWPEMERTLAARGFDSVAVSAATLEGIDALIYRSAEILAELRQAVEASEPEDELEIVAIQPPASHFEVERKRKTFYVYGEDAERLAVMTDMTSEEALYRLQRRLKQMGVFAALEKAGVHEGSTVRIGSVELTWDSSYEPEEKAQRRPSAEARKASGRRP